MSISPSDAERALGEIARVETRSQQRRGYRNGGATLMLWGVIWAVGYTATGLAPHAASKTWIVLSLLGMGVSAVFAAQREGGKSAGRRLPQWLGMAAATAIFVAAVYWLMRPRLAIQFEVMPVLVACWIYAMVGLTRLPRYLWIAGGVFGLTLVGLVYFQPILAYWIAVVGGSGLFVSGLWLRSA